MLTSHLILAASVQAQASRPPAGIDVDETRSVSLAAAQPQPCISIPLEGAIVLLGKPALDRLVADKPASSTTELERQALIAANRAQNLLAKLSHSRDAFGCFTTNSPLDRESEYLLLGALESGNATVKDLATGDIATSVRVRYMGDRCGPVCGRGNIMVYLPNKSHPFLVVNWWVS
jgi:hypothetical protein